jgi:hypothetical protein
MAQTKPFIPVFKFYFRHLLLAIYKLRNKMADRKFVFGSFFFQLMHNVSVLYIEDDSLH